jgi:hypothetical protein
VSAPASTPAATAPADTDDTGEPSPDLPPASGPTGATGNPPDAWERERNERIAARQGNANTFIGP